MINEPALQDALVSAFVKLHSIEEYQATLLIEIAAVRDALKEVLGQDFAEVFQRHQLARMTDNVKIESASKQLAEQLLQEVRKVVVL